MERRLVNTKWTPSVLKNTRPAVVSLRLSHWAIGIGLLGITANLLLQPDKFANPGTLLAAALNLLCLFAAPRYPLPTWAGYLLLFLLMSSQPDIRATVFTFFAPFISALIIYRGHQIAVLLGGVVLWYSGSVDPTASSYFPSDALASIVWAGILATAILTGHAFRRITEQRNDLIHQWDVDIRTRKESLARTLHDSVATSLTSVVMRAEALSLRRGLATDVHAELTAIADHARTSMEEVRSLLQVLNSDTEARAAESEPPVFEQLVSMAELLKAHGFTIAMAGTRPYVPLNADGLVVLREILAEIATNILKYAEHGSTVDITVNDHGNHAIISVINKLSSTSPGSHLSTGVGLRAISQLAASIGGELHTISSSTIWEIELRLPHTLDNTPG